MKVQFSKTTEYTPQFAGNRDLPADEQIKVTFTVMDGTDLMFLLDAFQRADIKEGVQPTAIQSEKLVQIAGELLPKYAELRGLTDQDDNPIGIDVVSRLSTFLGLSTELLMQLSVASQPTATAIKNSNPPPV